MNYACFDLEIARILPDDVDDLLAHSPLGITCAALAVSGRDEPLIWQGAPQLSRAECQAIVRTLQEYAAQGYTIVTWNGCGFDFRVLAEESGLATECGALALDHVDLMMIVTFTKGWFLGFDKALKGAGLEGKTKAMRTRDGSTVTQIGKNAPSLWAAGEYDVVLEYLKQDVTQLLRLAENVAKTHTIRWTSNNGKPLFVEVRRMHTARECFRIPVPDTSWMSHPPTREKFTEWIPAR